MPQYRVCQKIRTVANVSYGDHIRGFRFSNFEPQKAGGSQAWEARNDVIGDDGHDAFAKSRQALIALVDAMSVVTQCAASLVQTSYSVYRLEENKEQTIYLYATRETNPVGITLCTQAQARDIQKLAGLEGAALTFLREANNASTLRTRLLMLIAAAESLAGQTRNPGNCENCGFEYFTAATNRARLELILGPDAYERLYKKNGGALRHKLAHGSGAPEKDVIEALPLAYDGIRTWLEREHDLKSFKKIVSAPRTFDDSECIGLFLRPRGPHLPTLRELEEGWQEICDIVDPPPEEY